MRRITPSVIPTVGEFVCLRTANEMESEDSERATTRHSRRRAHGRKATLNSNGLNVLNGRMNCYLRFEHHFVLRATTRLTSSITLRAVFVLSSGYLAE